MAERILVTGGAGFIGCHVSRRLLDKGYNVRVLDCLIGQVHGGHSRPRLLPKEVELIRGDIRDQDVVSRALDGVDKVVHLASEVGVGQSMYEIERYVSVNELGTAVLFQQLIKRPVERVVTASSMSIYGEGLYRDSTGRFVEDAKRRIAKAASWDPVDDRSQPLEPLPTPEWKRPSLASVYALSKYAQERLTLTLTEAYEMEGVALRLFNVYGPGQALSNPYTGVLAIFASRILNGSPPLVFEDGRQLRDFVHVEDVAAAFELALTHPAAPGQTFNIGSGTERTICEIGQLLAAAMGCEDITPHTIGKFRAGDIRHCFGDISKARSVLGFEPARDFLEGLSELAEWVAAQQAIDRVPQARAELEMHGLVS